MRPLIIGIAGGTASGKSTVAGLVADELGYRCLHLVHDRYYRTLPERFHDAPTTYNFDHPDALETSRMVADVERLRAGQGTFVPNYDFKAHARTDEETWVEPTPILLIEGILVLADPQLRALMDHRVFVDAAADIRLIRRIHRDRLHRNREPLATIDQYMRTVRPMHDQFVQPSKAYAELVLDGEGQLEACVAAVLRLVE